MALFKRDLTELAALSALNSVTAELNPVDLQNINELTFYLIGSAGIASGAVQVESAHASGYAGTWAPEGAAITMAASTVKTVKITGVGLWARVRCSTVMSGGTVTVIVVGR